MPNVQATITAENTFSPALEFDHSSRVFNASVIDTVVFVATVTVQRSFDGGLNWHDVKQYTTPIQEIGDFTELGVQYRIGVKTGDYTSGTIDVRLSY